MNRQKQLTINALMTQLKAAQEAVIIYLHDKEFETAKLYQADVEELIKMIIELKTTETK